MPTAKNHLDQHQQMTLINKALAAPSSFFCNPLKLFDKMVNTCQKLMVSSKHRLPAAANANNATNPG